MSFDKAFSLLDARGTGRLSLDDVFGFVGDLDDPPKQATVKKVYDEFDADGSGDIDREEFLGLCEALEKLTKVSVDKMSEMYTVKCYHRLFQLCIDDGKTIVVGEQAEVSKKELKITCEQSGSVLKGDISTNLKKYNETMNFKEFAEFIDSMIQNQPISKVLKSFEESRKARLERRKKAFDKFDDGKAPPTIKKTEMVKPDPPTKSGVFKPPTPKEEPAIKKSPAAVEFETDMDCFAEAFSLIDSRGGGKLSLDNVYEFCEVLDPPPPQAAIRKLYNEFDEDGSGDIDSDEFLGFCKALEKTVGRSTEFMCAQFTKAMYLRLFQMADDSGDSNNLVSKDELKMLLEAISPMISSKITANEILTHLRDYPAEMDLENFTSAVKKLTIGKSISQVVTAFEEAKRRRKAARRYAIQRFDPAQSKNKSGLVVEQGETGAALCFSCVEKESKIHELEKLVSSLEAGESVVRQVSSVADEELALGDPFDDNNLHSLTQVVAASTRLKKYREYVLPALHYARSSRILELATFFASRLKASSAEIDSVARYINESAPKHDEHMDQLRAVTDCCMVELHIFEEQAKACLEGMKNGKADVVASSGMMLSVIREKTSNFRSDCHYLVDQICEIRSSCAMKSLTIAPYTNKGMKIMQALVEVENGTQQMLDNVTVMMQYGSSQLSDLEIIAKKYEDKKLASLSEAEYNRLNEIQQHFSERFSPDSWNSLFSLLQSSMKQLKELFSTSQGSKKEKGVQTQPCVDLSPLKNLKQKEAAEEPSPTAPADDNAYKRLRSTSPRLRSKHVQPRNAQQHVDRVIEQYVTKTDIPLPKNFQRVDPNSNQFYFGTKKIEVVPVDRFACVKVGGGYLLFDEFCRKYCEQEMRRFVIQQSQPPPELQRTGAVSYGGLASRGSTTPRTPNPGTPRVLVRQGKGLKLS